ncbi:hypothetical protein FG386_000079 [Cryptosporidium ryanae]|uniref:uncharacterized protein n=1 Tax=Cryptosporidium ryanae TaxID=515981 RepID=UPI00351AACC0|nr:hypothetical protein FG386_000079 [Cryptosporidium ryanae]
MNDLEDSTFRFYTSPEERDEFINYRSDGLRSDHDEFMLQSTARQSGYVLNSYIHGRAASEYSCSNGSIRELISSGDQTCLENSLSPVNHLEVTTSEVSTIPSARSTIECKRRGRSPSLSYTLTSFQAQKNSRQMIKNYTLNGKNVNVVTNYDELIINSNDRNPIGVLSRKSIDLNPPCLDDHNVDRTKIRNYNNIMCKDRKKENNSSSLCTFFRFCNCFGQRIKNIEDL